MVPSLACSLSTRRRYQRQLLDGPWTWDNTGIRFSPWLNATLYSAESDTPDTGLELRGIV